MNIFRVTNDAATLDDNSNGEIFFGGMGDVEETVLT